MSLEINSTEVKGIVMVKLLGNLDTNTAPDAEANISDWLEKGANKMIINLEDTKYVSSAGLRIFLFTAKKMTAIGGVVRLCCPNEVVQEVLDISGFSSILEVKSTEEEAIASV